MESLSFADGHRQSQWTPSLCKQVLQEKSSSASRKVYESLYELTPTVS